MKNEVNEVTGESRFFVVRLADGRYIGNSFAAGRPTHSISEANLFEEEEAEEAVRHNPGSHIVYCRGA